LSLKESVWPSQKLCPWSALSTSRYNGREDFSLLLPMHTLAHRRVTPELFRLAMAIVLFNTGYSIYLFLFNFYLAAQGRAENWMGVLQGVMILGSVFGTLPAGRCANRYGLRPTLAFSLAISGLLLALRPLAAPPALQLALALASGFFLSAWTVLIFPAIAATIDAEARATVFPWLYGLGIASGCLGALVGGWLPTLLPIAPLAARQSGLFVGAILIALTALLLPPDRQASLLAALAPMQKNLLPLLLASALFAFLLGCFNPFAGIFFATRFQLSLAAIGNFFFVVQILVALALALVGASAAQRFSPSCLLIGLQCAAGLTLAAMALPTLRIAAGSYLLFMIAQQLAQPALQALCMNQPSPQAQATVAARNALGIALAQAAATPLAGQLFRTYGYPHILPLLGLLTIAGSLVWLAVRHTY
jgi:MFS family permease